MTHVFCSDVVSEWMLFFAGYPALSSSASRDPLNLWDWWTCCHHACYFQCHWRFRERPGPDFIAVFHYSFECCCKRFFSRKTFKTPYIIVSPKFFLSPCFLAPCFFCISVFSVCYVSVSVLSSECLFLIWFYVRVFSLGCLFSRVCALHWVFSRYYCLFCLCVFRVCLPFCFCFLAVICSLLCWLCLSTTGMGAQHHQARYECWRPYLVDAWYPRYQGEVTVANPTS